MRTFREIKHDYRFTQADEQRLAALRPLMEAHADEVMGTLSRWFMGTRDAAKFFTDERHKKHVYTDQKKWFLMLFSGAYDGQFHDALTKIGSEHVRRSVDMHFMHRVANIVKNACTGILSKTEDAKDEYTNNIVVLGKIIDISLNVMTTAYIEEEMRIYSPVYKVKSALVTFAELFSQTTNLLLVIALIGLTLGVVWLFVHDVMNLVAGNVVEGIVSALGSMLLLWLMIELMNTEISHLKGGKFHISVFVGVALVTMIRETMIATLKHDKPESIYYLIAAILVIGIVYWLVVRTEHRDP